VLLSKLSDTTVEPVACAAGAANATPLAASRMAKPAMASRLCP